MYYVIQFNLVHSKSVLVYLEWIFPGALFLTN